MSICSMHKPRIGGRHTEAAPLTVPTPSRLVPEVLPTRSSSPSTAGPSGRQVTCAAAAVAEAPLTDKKVRRPDEKGRFGQFGGKYVPETLISALYELEEAYAEAQRDPKFKVR